MPRTIGKRGFFIQIEFKSSSFFALYAEIRVEFVLLVEESY